MRKKRESPPREVLESYLRAGLGKQAISVDYGASFPVVNRWLEEHGIVFPRYAGIVRPVPPDFVEWYSSRKPTKREVYERYGASYPLVKRWMADAGIEHVGSTSPRVLPPDDVLVELNSRMDTVSMARHMGVSPSKVVTEFRKRGLVLRKHGSGTSRAEADLLDFLRSRVRDFTGPVKGLMEDGRYEVDCWSPSLRIGFEFDGLFWHSRGGPDSHRRKLEMAERAGFRIFRVVSSDWRWRRDVVESMIDVRLGLVRSRVSARSLDVVSVSGPTARDFHDEHHLWGGSGCSVAVGLSGKDGLAACMTFSKSRYDGAEWEMTRFATRKNLVVVGGAGRLFARFVREKRPSSVVTFSDLSWGSGDGYEKIGFVRSGRTRPTFWYYSEETGERFSRQAFQKKKLERRMGADFDPGKTEEANAAAAGFYRYWDCGHERLVWTPSRDLLR